MQFQVAGPRRRGGGDADGGVVEEEVGGEVGRPALIVQLAVGSASPSLNSWAEAVPVMVASKAVASRGERTS